MNLCKIYSAGNCARNFKIIRNLSTGGQKRESSENSKAKTGILMVNMGGPSKLEQVQEFLTRIITDRDMMQLPMQSKLGPWIAKMRAPKVMKKYSEIGGGSPILKWSNLQGELMCQELDKISPESGPHKHYVGFRYADPLTEVALQQIEADGIEHMIIFSQYPHYSCATAGSSFTVISDYYKKRGLPKNMKLSIIDRWGTHPLLAQTVAERIKDELKHFDDKIKKDVMILFSAHSIPLRVLNRGDSYPSEIAATVHMVMNELNHSNPYQIVWQSKVGPLPWLGPATHNSLRGYVSQGKKNFIIVPIAFVNEHIETLHELDIQYCTDLARELKIEKIRRTPTPNDHPLFIKALADVVKTHLHSKKAISPKFVTRCPQCINENCQPCKTWFAQNCRM
ncbi:ferrochelatase, mitochondrial [Microplitis demolitor]|uniref:ferrochelatase, mitochondrial n=1 Tax=Microplitis demolitor TaxID=69319 RepID=UPI0004CD18C0|nr:ferrochelatase, mitochondrial [Microplitis demolitor]